jgi:hypothetical protein
MTNPLRRPGKIVALCLMIAALGVYFYLRDIRGIGEDHARTEERHLVLVEYASQVVFTFGVVLGFVENRRWKRHHPDLAPPGPSEKNSPS